MKSERGYKLLRSISEENGQEVQKLLTSGNIDFNVDHRGDNAIHLAARKGSLDYIKLLHKAGVDLQQKNVHGNTAMHYAARDGYLDIVYFLRTHKADMNPLNDLEGEAPIHKAVREQTMDVIEALVDLGMDPNIKNQKSGNTPLHVALESGAQEAMEGLLIKGAKPRIKNNNGQLPVDLAENNTIRSTLHMYESLLIYMNAGNIKAKGTKITRAEMEKMEKGILLHRVGVIVAHLDIPERFPTGIYCRREKVEHATVRIPHLEEEFSFGDVYHIRVYDVIQECKALLFLPLYEAPSDKEQMIVRFLCDNYDDFVADEYVMSGRNVYLPLDVILMPDTTCICMINIRQRIEKRAVGEQEATITSDMDQGFAMDIQSGSFEADTVLSLQVFETNPNDDVTETFDESDSEEEEQRTSKETATKSMAAESEKKMHSFNLLTNLYQINISGDQPKKTVTLTLPLRKGMTADENIVIIHANGTELNQENALEILPVQPQVVNGKIVFEVSQFCMFTSTRLDSLDSLKKARAVQQSLVDAKERRKPISFYALVQQDDQDATGLRHKVVIECHLAHKSQQQREKWIKKGYAEQNPPETGEIMAALGDSFVAEIQGNVRLEDSASELTRKIHFLKSRPCQQSFYVRLQENIYDQDDAFGYVMIYKSQKDNTLAGEIARLRIMVKPPRKAEDLPSSSVPSVTSVIKKKKKKSKSKKNAQPQDLKIKSNRGSVHTHNERGRSVTDFFARRDALYRAPKQVSIKPLKDAKKNGASVFQDVEELAVTIDVDVPFVRLECKKNKFLILYDACETIQGMLTTCKQDLGAPALLDDKLCSFMSADSIYVYTTENLLHHFNFDAMEDQGISANSVVALINQTSTFTLIVVKDDTCEAIVNALKTSDIRNSGVLIVGNIKDFPVVPNVFISITQSEKITKEADYVLERCAFGILKTAFINLQNFESSRPLSELENASLHEVYDQIKAYFKESSIPGKECPDIQPQTFEYPQNIDQAIEVIKGMPVIIGCVKKRGRLQIYIEATAPDFNVEGNIRRELNTYEIREYDFVYRTVKPLFSSGDSAFGGQGTLGGFVKKVKLPDALVGIQLRLPITGATASTTPCTLVALVSRHVVEESGLEYLTVMNDEMSIEIGRIDPINTAGTIDVLPVDVYNHCKDLCDPRFKTELNISMTVSKLSTIEDLHNWIRAPKSLHIWGAVSAPGKGTLIPGIFQTRNEARIIIRDRRSDEPFAQSGDSGAMVCYFDPRKEELYVVAMLVGLMEPGGGSQNRQYVAEILDVALQKLSLGNGYQLMLDEHDDL